MTKEKARTQFAELLAREEAELELDRAALLIAAEEYPHLETDKYLHQLDTFAALVRKENDFLAAPLSRVIKLGQVLSAELGFYGNAGNYYDARNSFLNEVIDRRTGIPITLSVVYLEVARRIGLKLHGVGMPGHFLVKYSDEIQEILIDPFRGGRILTEDQCREMIAEMYDGRMQFQSAFLRATSKKQILARMLQNLKAIYTHAQDHHKTLGVIERLLLINPESETEIRDRGMSYAAMGRLSQARTDLEDYLRRAPTAEDTDEVKKRLAQLLQQQARLN